MIRVLILFSLFILSSCAGSVTVSYEGCDLSDTQFASTSEIFRVDHTINKELWVFSSTKDEGKKLRIKKLLSDLDLACNKVDRLRVSLKQTLIDQIMSILPFISRMRVSLEVQMKT